ncbi:MAG TPA: hypothetical protein VJW96_08570 [Terriglobales bacterium]|nr:hypothetical protein [Terriglobales bacterium]
MKKNAASAALVLICSAFVLVSEALAANPPTNADELVAQHLGAIASPTVRAGFKTRVAQGPVRFTIMVGGAGVLDGKAVLVSDGMKLQFMMKLPNNEYHGEQFIFDGEKDKVAFSTDRQARSALGNFVFVQDAVIREGLLGGALTTAWPLLNLDERKAELIFDGLKKMDGQELYELRYRPRKNTDLEINLYFDPQTYRHVETIYSYGVSQSLIGSKSPSSTRGHSVGLGETPETAQARLTPNRYRLTEKFSDFKTVDGVTLPTHYDIQFSQELQNSRTTLWDWDIKGLDVSNNIGVDARNFEVK